MHKNIVIWSVISAFAVFAIWAVAGATNAGAATFAKSASPNTVDVWLRGRMSLTTKYPTADFTFKVKNNTNNAFRTEGHIVATEDGVAFQPVVLTFPFYFDGAKPDLHWHMPLYANMTQTVKFTVRVTAKRRYCLKVNLDVTYRDAPKGGVAYVKGCVNVRP